MPQSPPGTKLTGFDLLNQPLLNKGTAFTEAERDAFAPPRPACRRMSARSTTR